MKSSRLLALFAVFALSLGVALPTARPATPPDNGPLDVFLSAGDSWWFGTWLPVDSAGSIHDSVQMWSDVLKMKRIYWRGEQEEMMVDYGVVHKDNLEFHEFLETWERHLVKEEHLNQVLVTEAHSHHIEVFLWAPLFDYGGEADNGGCKEYPYALQLNLTRDHPEWMPIDRYGVRHQNGPIELAYPEARKELIDIYLHYIDRDHLDGVTFFTYCENFGLRYEDEFGFNDPVVNEYKRRYGVDIRTQAFDKPLWRKLRGEYVTQFLREFKTALKARGKKLGVRLNPREPNDTDRWNVPAYFLTSGRIYIDWEGWVREGIVDEVAISGSAPWDMQKRTMDNVMLATRGMPVDVSKLVSQPFSDRLKPYVAQGMRRMLFETDDASYIKLVYPAQTEAALTGSDIYGAIRFLSQVAEGTATIASDRILPLLTHKNILVRRQALRALGTLQDPKTIPALEAALNDPERSVRSSAIFALQKNHGPASVTKMIAAVRKVREFQAFEAVSSVMSTIETSYLPEIRQLAGDSDGRMRRLAIYALARRREVENIPVLITGSRDPEVYTRFRAVSGLKNFGANPQAVETLMQALDDPSIVIQDRTAVSLAVALVKGATMKPRHGFESSGGMLETKMGPLPEIQLDEMQAKALDALTRRFREFGDASKRTDLEWGFRPVGNAMLAFGSEGGKRLQAMIDQKSDHRLASLAWKVLYIRQGIENFCRVPGEGEANAAIYSSYPGEKLSTEEGPSPVVWNPLDKDN